MSNLNCKHPDLIVQRNYGYRWVTCTECFTDFIPANGERVEHGSLIQSEWKAGKRIWTLVMDRDVDGPMNGRYRLLVDPPKEEER